MGGEWYFEGPTLKPQTDSTSSKNEKSLNVNQYQELLLRLKTQYEKQFDDKHVKWCDVNALPPPDNVFARFKFTCDRHGDWNEPEHPWFNLYWVPVTEESPKMCWGSLHDGCNFDYTERETLFNIQREIVERFADHFVLYREWTDCKVYDSKGSGMTYYGRSDDYDYPRSPSRSPEDYTACDKECGYCGHCPY